MADLLEYKYLDTDAIDSYIEQLSSVEVEGRSRTTKFAASLAGPSVEYSASSRYRPKSNSEKIKELIEHLSQKKLLERTRPKLMREFEQQEMPPFFLETVTARKIILPAALLADSGIKQLAVWVSDPDPRLLISERSGWDFPGSFLYLTELHLDGGRFHTVYSGCSALQAIANATQSRAPP